MKSLTNPSFIRSLRQFLCTSIICLARLIPQIISPTIYISAQIQIYTYIYITTLSSRTDKFILLGCELTMREWIQVTSKYWNIKTKAETQESKSTHCQELVDWVKRGRVEEGVAGRGVCCGKSSKNGSRVNCLIKFVGCENLWVHHESFAC